MANAYLSTILGAILFGGLTTPPVAGQAADLPAAASIADAPQFPTPLALADSLAAVPAGGTLRVQGLAQPTQPFQSFQEQLRTVAGVQASPYSGAPGAMVAVRIRGAPAWPATRSRCTWWMGCPHFKRPSGKAPSPTSRFILPPRPRTSTHC